MDIYETVLILKPVMSDPEVSEFVDKTKQTIAGDGGEIVTQEIWGRRKLTHPIGKNREGVYTYFKYKANPGLLKKLSHNFSIADNIMATKTTIWITPASCAQAGNSIRLTVWDRAEARGGA